jgi:hypothetical protein
VPSKTRNIDNFGVFGASEVLVGPVDAPAMEVSADKQVLLFTALVIVVVIAHLDRLPLTRYRRPEGPTKLVQWRRQARAFHRNLGCTPKTFDSLVDWCLAHGLDAGRVEAEEKVAIFIYICRFGVSVSVVEELFGRSRSTISRAFHAVLDVLQSLHDEVVLMPNAFDPVPPEIAGRGDVAKYFKDCIGAIDGTHIPASLPTGAQTAWRNRKGYLSQNVFAACSFDLRFQFVHAGWEGSAHDALVLRHALSTGRFKPPPGRYFLADSGFYNADFMIVPYTGVRYHLNEWAQVIDGQRLRPETPEELFNLRHSSMRSAIERIFGVFKRKFQIMAKPTEYKIEDQVRLVVALTAVFNFIAQRDRNHAQFDKQIEPTFVAPESPAAPAAPPNLKEEKEIMKKMRDTIAREMWADYLATSRSL